MNEVIENLKAVLQTQNTNGCSFRYAMVDAHLARELLSLSAGNRTISADCVKKYAQHMKRGTWETDNPTQFIMFDEDGVLINGHHTLRAVIRSGCTVKLYFMFDMKRSPHIDSGRMRSEADRFAIMYGIKGRYSYKRAVSICNILNRFGVVDLITDTERWEYINRNIAHFNHINLMRGKAGTGLSTAPIFAAMFIAKKNGANPASLQHFWEVLQDGAIRNQNDRSIINLRDWLMRSGARSRNNTLYRRNTLYVVSDVLCKWLKECPVSKIQIPEALNTYPKQLVTEA